MENFDFSGEVVIGFYGNGCLNCQMMTPILRDLEKCMPTIRFYHVNADDYPDLVQKYQVTSLPSLLLFRNGRLLSTIVGVKSSLALRMLIDDTLNYA